MESVIGMAGGVVERRTSVGYDGIIIIRRGSGNDACQIILLSSVVYLLVRMMSSRNSNIPSGKSGKIVNSSSVLPVHNGRSAMKDILILISIIDVAVDDDPQKEVMLCGQER